MLADSRFDAVFGQAPRQRWRGVDLVFTTDRWTLQLNLERPAESVIATVDPVSGDVLKVEVAGGDPEG